MNYITTVNCSICFKQTPPEFGYYCEMCKELFFTYNTHQGKQNVGVIVRNPSDYGQVERVVDKLKEFMALHKIDTTESVKYYTECYESAVIHVNIPSLITLLCLLQSHWGDYKETFYHLNSSQNRLSIVINV